VHNFLTIAAAAATPALQTTAGPYVDSGANPATASGTGTPAR
jgi:hypothetical protein